MEGAPSHPAQLGSAPGKGTGDGLGVGTRRQHSSQKATGLSLHLWFQEGVGTFTQCRPWEQEARPVLGGVLGGAGQWWLCPLDPRLGEGEDSILRPPQSLGLMALQWRKAVSPGWVGSGPSGVLNVLDVPQGRLVQDTAHLLQTLCLADPLQAHLWSPGREAEGAWWGNAAPPLASPPGSKGPGPVSPGAPHPPTMVKPALREEMVLRGQPEEAWGGVCAADTVSMPTCQALGEGLPMTDTHESWNVFEQQLRGKDHAAPKGGRLP